MLKCLLLCFFLFQFYAQAERRTGRHPAVLKNKNQILKELGVQNLKEAQEEIFLILQGTPKGSGLHNQAILYRDSIKSLQSAPKRVHVYHQSTFEKFWERFKKGLTLKTLMELLGLSLLLGALVYYQKKNNMTLKTKSSKNFFHISEELFSLKAFQILRKRLGRKEYFNLKSVIKNVVDEVNFMTDFENPLLLNYQFNKNRFLLSFSLPQEISDQEYSLVVDSVTPVLKALNPRFYYQKSHSPTFVISLELDKLAQAESSTIVS